MPNVSDEQLLDAAGTGDLSVLKEWKEQNEGRDVNTVKYGYFGSTPLHRACNGGHLECVKYLIESTNADVNTVKNNDGDTPLHEACATGHLECAKYLVESTNADVNCKNNDGYTPLHEACYGGSLECVKYLIESTNADVNCKNNDGYTTLHGACYNGHLECVKHLVESTNADVNCKNNNGYTPLHGACYAGSLECVEYLIESANADVNCKDNGGYTPLHYACIYGHPQLVKYLIESTNADVNCKDNNGYTPLHEACIRDYLECVKCLIETCNADVNCKANNGNTPLHKACINGKSECVEYLIESTKVNIDIRNNDNKTPVELINANKQVRMMRSIMKRLGHLSRRNLQLQTQLQTEMQVRKQSHTNTTTTPTKHDNPKIHTTTNISIDQDRRSAVRSEAKADITFLCGQGDEQQPIKANSGVLMVTVPSIQTLIDSGIQHQHVDDGTDDGTDSATALTRRLIPLPNHQPKHVQRVLECIYTGEISFDHSAPDNDTDTRDGVNDDDDGADQPTLTLDGQDDLQQLILVANEFGFWRLKLVLEAELARAHLTEDTMIDMVIFANQHGCLLLKDASMRLAAANIQTFFAREDFSKLCQHPQLMGGIHVLRSGGAASDEVDDKYSAMSMMDLYKVVDESEGPAQVDSYMDRATLVSLVRSVAPSRVAEADGTAAEEEE